MNALINALKEVKTDLVRTTARIHRFADVETKNDLIPALNKAYRCATVALAKEQRKEMELAFDE